MMMNLKKKPLITHYNYVFLEIILKFGYLWYFNKKVENSWGVLNMVSHSIFNFFIKELIEETSRIAICCVIIKIFDIDVILVLKTTRSAILDAIKMNITHKFHDVPSNPDKKDQRLLEIITLQFTFKIIFKGISRIYYSNITMMCTFLKWDDDSYARIHQKIYSLFCTKNS